MSGDFQIAHPLIKAAEAAEANRLPPELILGAEVITLVLENPAFLSFYTLMAKHRKLHKVLPYSVFTFFAVISVTHVGLFRILKLTSAGSTSPYAKVN